MNEEFELSLKDAEHRSEQRRLSKNESLRRQTTMNLIDGLSPYVFPRKEDSNRRASANTEATTLLDSMCTSDTNSDIDFDPITRDDSIENNEDVTFEEDETESTKSLSVLDELFWSEEEHLSRKDGSDLLPLHSYTNISSKEFCVNLIRAFREANLCKTYSSNMLTLIHSALPQPNNLPGSVNAIMRNIQGKVCFD
jgi:hypothetical protein